MMGQIANGMAKREMTYSLKVQSGYDGLDCKWHDKGRNDVLSERAERVRQVRSGREWHGKREK